MLPLYLAAFSTSLIVAYTIFKFTIPLAQKLGYIDIPNERKLHSTPIPYGGGVAIFLSLVVATLILLFPIAINWQDVQNHTLLVNLGSIPLNQKTIAIALGACAIFFLGLFDDIYDIKPKLKLFLQTLIISCVIHFGSIQISFFIENPLSSFLGTLIWMLFITNAFNLLDNMDGLCSGISLITLTINFVLLLQNQQYLIALTTLFVMAPIFIFFTWNKPPAKLYLGDAGSLLIGFIIANLSILSTYYREGQNLASIFTPLLILAIPIFDVLTVMWIRYKNKKPFFQGDKNHFSHRLLNLGMSTWQALWTIYAISITVGIGGILLSSSNNTEATLIFIQAFITLCIVLVLEKVGKKHQEKSLDTRKSK